MSHSSQAHSVHARLHNRAKEREEDFNLVLRRFGLERFLYRLSKTAHRSRFILKGAMLFQIWDRELFRPTGDMDFLARGEVTSETLATDVREICAVACEEDGLVFDVSNLKVIKIREQSDHGGTRASFLARLGNARIPIQIDFGIGDAVTPAPVETDYPTLLDMPKPSIYAYPRETVIAEKLDAIIGLGFDNSRMKDYFDLWYFATTYPEDRSVVAEALQATLELRGQAIPTDTPSGLSDAFASDPMKQAQWRSFREKMRTELELSDVVKIIRDFAMPIFAEALRK